MATAEDLTPWVRRLSFAMWGIVGVALLLETLLREEALTLECGAHWMVALGTCGLAFWLTNRHEGRGRRFSRLALLVLQVATALYMIRGWESTVGSFLLVFTAWQAARAWPMRLSLAWAVAQTLLLAATTLSLAPRLYWLAVALVSGGLQSFAVLLAHLARSEAAARLREAKAHAELRGLHELLERAGRSDERLRLARELHDGMGHRLTALNLALEAGLHQEPTAARESLARARTLLRELLSELRAVVGTLRSDPQLVDLAEALQGITGGIRSPRIHLGASGRLEALDPARAHVLARCAQELVTNAVKHAQARNLWIEVAVEASGVLLRVRDDGRGCTRIEEGHGLCGLHERVALLGGRLGLDGGPPGFAAEIWLPPREAAA